MGVYFGNAKVFLKLLDQVDQIAFHLRSLNTIIDDVWLMANVLMSIPPKFRVFSFAWESTPITEKALEKLTSCLITLDEHAQRWRKPINSWCCFLSQNTKRADTHSEESKEHALPAQHDRGKGGGSSSHQYSGERKEYWECGTTIHISELNVFNVNAVTEKEEDESVWKRKRYDRYEMMIVEEIDEELTTVIAIKVIDIKRSTRENERGTAINP